MSDCLSSIFRRFEWKGEVGLEIVDPQKLGVLEFKTLGAVCGNWRDFDGECGARAVLPFLFEQAGINALQCQVAIYFFSASFFEYHPRDSHIAIPDGKVGYCSRRWNQEDVTPLLRALGAVAEDLHHSHASVLVVDYDLHRHLVEREHRGLRLFRRGRDEHAGLRGREWCR